MEEQTALDLPPVVVLSFKLEWGVGLLLISTRSFSANILEEHGDTKPSYYYIKGS
jgi:hypothetical protein